MPETDVIPTSASVASTGKGIRYIGDYAYAYSGIIGIPNSDTTMLEFTSGSGILKANIHFYYTADSSVNMSYRVRLNNALILDYMVTGFGQDTNHNPNHLIIPPLTKVKISAEGASATTQQAVTLVGRVYGEE